MSHESESTLRYVFEWYLHCILHRLSLVLKLFCTRTYSTWIGAESFSFFFQNEKFWQKEQILKFSNGGFMMSTKRFTPFFFLVITSMALKWRHYCRQLHQLFKYVPNLPRQHQPGRLEVGWSGRILDSNQSNWVGLVFNSSRSTQFESLRCR